MIKSLFRLALAIAVMAVVFPAASPTHAQDDAPAFYRITLDGNISTCLPNLIFFTGLTEEIRVPDGQSIDVEAQVLVNGVQTYTESASFDTSLTFGPSLGFFPLGGDFTPPFVVQTVFTTYLDGNAVYRSTMSINCTGIDEPTTATVVNEALLGAPGCDQLIAIPETAVGGSFVAPAPVYWAPGQLVNPAVTIGAGNTALVLGVDSSGDYYKIIWGCQYVWVPVSTMGPNFDAVWNGAPLPTNVVS